MASLDFVDSLQRIMVTKKYEGRPALSLIHTLTPVKTKSDQSRPTENMLSIKQCGHTLEDEIKNSSTGFPAMYGHLAIQIR